MIVLKAVERPDRSERRPGKSQNLLLKLEEEAGGKRSFSTQRSALAKVEARVNSIREK